MSAFDEDTRIAVRDDATWQATVTPRWSIGPVPNGGYLMAIVARALARTLPHPDPLVISTYFLERGAPGPAEVRAEVVRAGRGVSTGAASLSQEGRVKLSALATFGDLDARSGRDHVGGVPPMAPEPDVDALATPAGAPDAPTILERFDFRLDARSSGAFVGQPNEEGIMSGWIRFADGRPPDVLSLLTFADAFPPAVFNLFGVQPWVPTLELTVQLRHRPAPGWLRARFVTRHVSAGDLEEDGELWDADGRLVALSRQLARVVTGPAT